MCSTLTFFSSLSSHLPLRIGGPSGTKETINCIERSSQIRPTLQFPVVSSLRFLVVVVVFMILVVGVVLVVVAVVIIVVVVVDDDGDFVVFVLVGVVFLQTNLHFFSTDISSQLCEKKNQNSITIRFDAIITKHTRECVLLKSYHVKQRPRRVCRGYSSEILAFGEKRSRRRQKGSNKDHPFIYLSQNYPIRLSRCEYPSLPEFIRTQEI